MLSLKKRLLYYHAEYVGGGGRRDLATLMLPQTASAPNFVFPSHTLEQRLSSSDAKLARFSFLRRVEKACGAEAGRARAQRLYFGHYCTIKSQSVQRGSLVESRAGLREHLGLTLTGPPVKRGSPLCVPVNLIRPLKFI